MIYCFKLKTIFLTSINCFETILVCKNHSIYNKKSKETKPLILKLDEMLNNIDNFYRHLYVHSFKIQLQLTWRQKQRTTMEKLVSSKIIKEKLEPIRIMFFQNF